MEGKLYTTYKIKFGIHIQAIKTLSVGLHNTTPILYFRLRFRTFLESLVVISNNQGPIVYARRNVRMNGKHFLTQLGTPENFN